MVDSSFKLREKTVIINGPIGRLTHSLTSRLTELGADVALLHKDAADAQRFCRNIMDLREVNANNGRAAAVESDPDNDRSAENDLSRAAELFGSVDVFIDTNLFALEVPFYRDGTDGKYGPSFDSALAKTQLMTKAALKFLQGRNKGRIIFVSNQLDPLQLEQEDSRYSLELLTFTQHLARDVNPQNIMVNNLAVGLSEEYLLSRFPDAATISAARDRMKETFPHAKIVDAAEIANAVAYFSSPLSSGITGQTVNINHGL